MAKKFDPPIEADLGRNPGKVKFSTLKSLRQWTEEEEESWQWLLDDRVKNTDFEGGGARLTVASVPPMSQAISHQIETIRKLLNLIQSAENTDDRGNLGSISSKIQDTLENYTKGYCLHSTTPLAQRIFHAKDVDPPIAVAMLAGFQTSLAINPRDSSSTNWLPLVIKGISLAARTQHDDPGEVASHKAAHEELRVRLNDLLVEAKEQVTARDEECAHLLSGWHGKLKRLHGAAAKTHKAVRDESKGRLTELESYFKERVGIQSSVSYWRGKQKNHLIAGIVSGAAFLSIVVAVLIAAWLLHKDIGGFLKADSGALNPAAIFLLGLPAALILWVLRLTSRVFVTNLTLQSDASGRVAMTETFLALIKEQQVEPDDRALILQSLFRPPAVAGGAEDDNAPPSVLDAFIRQMTRKG